MPLAVIEGCPTSEAGRALGCSAARIRQMIAAGEIDYIETPLGRLIPESEIARIRQNREDRSVAKAQRPA